MLRCEDCTGSAPLCDRCLAQRLSWLAGNVRALGERWGVRVRRASAVGPWPAWGDPRAERMQAVARRKVAALAGGDDRLEELLAKECAAAAADAFLDSTPVPGEPSFRVGDPKRRG